MDLSTWHWSSWQLWVLIRSRSLAEIAKYRITSMMNPGRDPLFNSGYPCLFTNAPFFLCSLQSKTNHSTKGPWGLRTKGHYSWNQTTQLFGVWINGVFPMFEHFSSRVYLIIFLYIYIYILDVSIYTCAYRCQPYQLSHHFCSFPLDSAHLSVTL